MEDCNLLASLYAAPTVCGKGPPAFRLFCRVGSGAQLLVPFRHECCNALVGLLNKLIGDLLDVFSSTIEVGEMGPANNAQQPVRILLGVRFNKIRLVADE